MLGPGPFLGPVTPKQIFMKTMTRTSTVTSVSPTILQSPLKRPVQKRETGSSEQLKDESYNLNVDVPLTQCRYQMGEEMYIFLICKF